MHRFFEKTQIMELWLDITYFVVGLVLIIFGADWLTNGASGVARRFNVSTLIIGLTIVAFGTSMPELVVSVTAAIQGHSEMAIGNVVGSNLFNTFAIVGATALICPVVCGKDMRHRDIIVNIVVSLLLLLFVYLWDADGENAINRWEGIILLLVFAAYMFWIIRAAKQKKEQTDDKTAAEPTKPMKMGKAILLIVLGLGGLVGGGQLFVDGASGLAQLMGVSESVIALTIVAAGTSMPELATSVAAAMKHDTDMAIGNVVGSNIFNILLILGTSSCIQDLTLGSITRFDFICMAISIVVLFIFVYLGKGLKISRLEGAIMVLMIIAYYTFVVIQVA